MYAKVHTVNAQKKKKKTTSHWKEMRVYSGATLSDHGLGIQTSVTHIPCSSVEAVSWSSFYSFTEQGKSQIKEV